MASPLDKMKAQIAKGMGKMLFPATVWRYVPGEGVDEWGDANKGSWVSYPAKGIVEEYDDAYRATAMIPATDVKILLLAGTVAVDVRKDDVIFIREAFWQARAVKTDPASATWGIQAYGISRPEDLP